MKRTITEPCVREDMPADEYHGDPVAPEPSLSAGGAHRIITATPLHAWTESPRLNPDFEPVEKEAFDVGRYAHALLTGQDERIAVIDAEDWRSKAAREERDYARERGMIPLLAAQFERCRAMTVAVRQQLRAAKLADPFEAGVCEASLFWRAEGVWNRCRPDTIIAETRTAWDLKTSAELADPSEWTRRAYAFGADLRAAHYVDGLKALYGGEWTYRFVVVEKSPPHALSVLELDEDAMLIGAKKLAEARRLWRECLDANRWPAWPALVSIVPPPPWAEAKWLAREDRNEALRSMSPTGKLIDAAIRWQGPAA